MRRSTTPWGLYALAAALFLTSLILFDAAGCGPNGSRKSAPTSTADAQKNQLCPFGLDANACLAIQQADVDGDGAQDLVSVVFNNSLSTGMIHVIVRFATGEVSKEQIFFGDDRRVAGAITSKVSFLGFADVNELPGQEIFVRMFVDGYWNFAMVQYCGEKSIVNGHATFSSGELPSGPDLASAKFQNGAGAVGKIVANGLRYADFGAQKHVLVLWIVVQYPDGSFDVRTAGFAPEKPGSTAYEATVSGTTFEPHRASEAAQMNQHIANQRGIAAPGFVTQ